MIRAWSPLGGRGESLGAARVSDEGDTGRDRPHGERVHAKGSHTEESGQDDPRVPGSLSFRLGSPPLGIVILAVSMALITPAAAASESAVEAPLAIESLLLDGAVAGSRVVVVGERGHILVSTDDGRSWKQSQVPTRAMLTAVHMHDERIGWAVGHDAVILRTDDGGTTWRLVHHAPEEERPLLDVWFRDERTGFAVGAYGYFLATEDGGESWVSRTISEDDFHLNALVPAGAWSSDAKRTDVRQPARQLPETQRPDDDPEQSKRLARQPEALPPATQGPGTGRPDTRRLFIAAEAGVAYRSDDAGETWRELPSPYAGSWFGALALDADHVLLFGLRGRLFHSEDTGETWTQVTTGTNATLTDAVRLPSSDQVLITGLEGALLTSPDGGRSVSFTRLASRQGISAARVLPDGDVLLIGEFGVQRLPRSE